MPLRTIKAKAAQAAQLLASLKRRARALQAFGPVLVVYGRDEGARIYYEAESPPDKSGRSGS